MLEAVSFECDAHMLRAIAAAAAAAVCCLFESAATGPADATDATDCDADADAEYSSCFKSFFIPLQFTSAQKTFIYAITYIPEFV
uniref:Secreted protein n=1 Tax=Syphacia muris TaxID=451379 RepID=A0A0N5AMR0_9BILA